MKEPSGESYFSKATRIFATAPFSASLKCLSMTMMELDPTSAAVWVGGGVGEERAEFESQQNSRQMLLPEWVALVGNVLGRSRRCRKPQSRRHSGYIMKTQMCESNFRNFCGEEGREGSERIKVDLHRPILSEKKIVAKEKMNIIFFSYFCLL